MAWRCPVCRDALREEPGAWRCDADHSFDVAREGYVNLLITHQRRARPPGDSAEQLRDRRAFLEGGHYEPVAEAVGTLVPVGSTVADVGCGEGWYDRRLHGRAVWGVDIAKEAVRLAARSAPTACRYAVGNAYDLPLLDASVDVALAVFAPMHSPELARVARRHVLTVTPGPSHLRGLAQLLFDEPEPHPSGGPLDGVLPIVEQTTVRYDLEIDDGDTVGRLLGMTPWAWYVGEETKRRVAERGRLVTPVETILTLYGTGEHDGPHG